MDMLGKKLFDYGRSIYARLGERRTSERRACHGTVAVNCDNHYGSTYVCSCINLSDTGIGLVSFEPIPVKCDVYLYSEGLNLKSFGRIRWCVLKGDHYVAGCDFRSAPKFRSRGLRVTTPGSSILRPANSRRTVGLDFILKRFVYPPPR